MCIAGAPLGAPLQCSCKHLDLDHHCHFWPDPKSPHIHALGESHDEVTEPGHDSGRPVPGYMIGAYRALSSSIAIIEQEIEP